MQAAWAKFAKDPAGGPGWSTVATPDNRDMGIFQQDGSLQFSSPDLVDQNCRIFKKVLELRVHGQS
jgi:hypothetical protein